MPPLDSTGTPDDLVPVGGAPPAQAATPAPAFPSDLMPIPKDIIPIGGGTAKPPPPADTGILAAPFAGMLSASREVGQTGTTIAGAFTGEKPTPLPAENTVAAQPPEWGDVLRPKQLAEKALYQFGKNFPTLTGGIAGGVAGEAIAGPPGAVAGGGLGAWFGTAFQKLGPEFAQALQENPKNPEAAFNTAVTRTATQAGVAGVSWALFGWQPFSGTVKNMLFQAFGVQPAVTAGGTAVENVVEGRPAGQGVAESIPGAVVGTLTPMAGHAALPYASAAARRLFGAGAPAPTPGAAPGAAPGTPPSAGGPGAGPAVPPDTMPPPGTTVNVQGLDQPFTVKGYRGAYVDLDDPDGKPRVMKADEFARLHTVIQPAPAPTAPTAPTAEGQRLLPPPETIQVPGQPWTSTGEGLIPGTPGAVMQRPSESAPTTRMATPEEMGQPPTLDDIDRWATEEQRAQAAGENPTPAEQVTSPVEQAVEAATKPAMTQAAAVAPQAIPKTSPFVEHQISEGARQPLGPGVPAQRMPAFERPTPTPQPVESPATPAAEVLQPPTAPQTPPETPEARPAGNEPTVTDTTHTKTGAPISVVQLPDRVDSDRFKALGKQARGLGGYYSSFRGKGAIPGFVFKTRDAADQFAALAKGEVPAAPTPVPPVPPVPAPQPPTSNAPGWEEIGKNYIGQTIYEDQRGARSYIENGVRHTEPVGMVPTREGMQVSVAAPTDKDLEYQVATPHPARPGQAVEYPPPSPTPAVPMPRPPTPQITEPPEGTRYVLPSFVTAPHATEVTASPHIALAGMVEQRLATGAGVGPSGLQRMAEQAFGVPLASGKFTRADMYDAMELGVNRYVEAHPELFSPITDLTGAKAVVARLEDLKNRLPTQTVRAGEKDTFQQFSTPPDYAYTAAWAANIRPSQDSVIEPSAGTGSLVVMAHNAGPRELITNELSANRAPLVESLNPDRAFRENAEQLHNILPADVKPTVVLMNPPFSATAGRMGDKTVLMTGARHVEQALERLEPGGRLVAIVGQGMRPFTGAAAGPRVRNEPTGKVFQDWWRRISQNYDVRANIGIPGSVYGKYGTTFGTRLLVIDKGAPGGRPPVEADAKSLPEAMEMLDAVRQDRPALTGVAGQPVAAKPGSEAVAAPSAERPTRPEPAIPGPTSLGGVRPGTTSPRGARPEILEPGAGVRGTAEPGPRPSAADTLPSGQPERPERGGAEPESAGATQPGEDLGGGVPVPDGGVLRPDVGAGPVLPQPGDARLDVPDQPVDPPIGKPTPPSIRTEELAAEPAGADITADVFEPYRPQKITIAGAKPHPGKLVQSAAMASVDPPDARGYQPSLPRELISSGALSEAQLEPVIYAGAAHNEMLPEVRAGDPTLPEGWKPIGKNEFGATVRRGPNGEEGIVREGAIPKGWVRIGTNPDGQAIYENENRDRSTTRRGYFIGDGTGVGKGREVAAIILDNMNQGRKKAVWLSASANLIEDAGRDWKGIGQDPKQLFSIGATNKAGEPIKQKDGIGFMTYSTLTGKAKGEKGQKRIDQLVNWLGKDFDGVIAFDESHKMGNAIDQKGNRGVKKASQTALTGIELQKRVPNARVLYVSATGATEVMNLAYASRLGLWGRGTPFVDAQKFIGDIHGGGVAAMELVARDLKALGLYTARSLSYQDVRYDRVEHPLSDDQKTAYDQLAEAWQSVLRNMDAALEAVSPTDYAGKPIVDGKAKSAARSAFWGAHQRFFNQVLTSMQMPAIIKGIEGDLKEGRQALVQFVNTGEASQRRAIAARRIEEGDEADLEDLDLTPKQLLMQMIEKSFPIHQLESYIDDNGNEGVRPVVDSKGNPVENATAKAARNELLNRVGAMSGMFPDSPLDQLLKHFGYDNVAEVTGRTARIEMRPDKQGNLRTVEVGRAPGTANKQETAAYQSGKKKILAFSDAGGAGRSYHADIGSGSENAQRSHYLAQPGWIASNAVQGLGRAHRSNQASAPILHLVTTDIQGQRRFISSIARRLAQLGALTRGERRAGEQGLFGPRDNLESREAEIALDALLRDVYHGTVEGLSRPEFERQTGIELSDKDGKYRGNKVEIKQFLNRLLSLKIAPQNHLFGQFEQRLDSVIEARAAAGELDVGTEAFKADRIDKKSEQVVHTDERTGAATRYVRLEAQRLTKARPYEEVAARNPEFYVRSKRTGRISSVEASPLSQTEAKTGTIHPLVRMTTPLSYQFARRANVEYGANWERVDPADAKNLWDEQVAALPPYQSEDVHLITGVTLPIWDRLNYGSSQIFRLKTSDGESMLGRVIPEGALARTLQNLGAEGRQFTPAEVADQIMSGGQARLANGWKLSRRIVAGEPRIELTGPYGYGEEVRQLERDGVYSERIGYNTRLFVPTGTEAERVIGRLVADRPVVSLSGAGAGEEEEPAAGLAEGAPQFQSKPSRDVSDDFHQVVPYTRDAATNHCLGANYVLRRGAETGNEYLALHDPISGKGLIATTSDEPNFVRLPDRDATGLVAHHNHPDNTSLSVSDLTAMVQSGLGAIMAHGHDGSSYGAWLPRGVEGILSHQQMQAAWLLAADAADKAIRGQLRTDRDVEGANKAFPDLVNRALAAVGLTHYVSTIRPTNLIPPRLADQAFRAATSALTGGSNELGLTDYPAWAVRPADAMARVSRAAQDIAARRSGRSSGNTERGAGLGPAPRAAAPTAGGLAEERPRYTLDDFIDQAPSDAVERILGPPGKPPSPPMVDRALRALGVGPRQPGRAERWFNFVNRFTTTPANAARYDFGWVSRQKYQAEQAKSDRAAELANDYITRLGDWARLSPEDHQAVNAALELERLQGITTPLDGRSIVVENRSHPLAQNSRLGEIITLDTPARIQAYAAYRRATDKMYSDLVAATARSHGWTGAPTAAAISEAAGRADNNPPERKRLERVAKIVGLTEYARRTAYTPFMRIGDYYFSVTPKAGTPSQPGVAGWDGEGYAPTVWYSRIDSRLLEEKLMGGTRQASPTVDAHRAELLKTFPDDRYNISEGYYRPTDLKGMDVSSVEDLFQAIGRDFRREWRDRIRTSPDPEAMKTAMEQAEELHNQAIDALLNQFYENLKAGFRRESLNIPGYIPDLTQTTGIHASWMSHHIANLENREAIEAADRKVDQSYDPRTRAMWHAYDRDMDHNEDDTGFNWGINRLKQAAFYYALGGNVASTVRIMMHAPMLGWPTLSLGLNPAKVGATYLGAMKDVLKTVRANIKEGATASLLGAANTPDERALLERAEATGLTHSKGHEALGAITQHGAEAYSPQKTFVRQVLDVWSSNIAVADRLIRGAMLLAAYRTAKQPGAMDRINQVWSRGDELWKNDPEKTPESFARFMVDRSAGLWGRANQSQAQRHPLGGLALQFHGYEMNLMSTLHQMAWHMGRPGKFVASMILGSIGAMAGVLGLPFMQDIEDAYEGIYKFITHIDPNLNERFMEFMRDDPMGWGASAGRAFLYGMQPGGVDMSSMSFGNLAGRTAQSPMGLVGAGISMPVGDVQRAIERYNSEQSWLAIAAELMPNGIKHVVNALGVYPDQGIRSAAGNVIVPPAKITGSEQAELAAGFEPASVANTYREDERDYRLREAQTAKAQGFNTQVKGLSANIAQSEARGDYAQANELRQELAKVIQAAAAASIRVTSKTIGSAELQATQPEARQMQLAPKAVRGQVAQPMYTQP